MSPVWCLVSSLPAGAEQALLACPVKCEAYLTRVRGEHYLLTEMKDFYRFYYVLTNTMGCFFNPDFAVVVVARCRKPKRAVGAILQ